MSAVALTAVLCSRSAPGQGASRDAVETVAIRVHEGTTLSFDLSPDGRSIVFDLLGALWELPSAGGVARPLTDAVRDTAEDLDPSYSPDGRRIVFRAERRGRTGLWLLERGGARLQLTQLPNPEGYEGNAAWSPDGRTIAYARLVPPDSTVPRWHSRLARIDLATREVHELPVAESVGPNLRDPAFQPGGTHLLVVAGFAPASAGGRIWMVESGSGRATPLGPATTEAVAPAFSPDGRRLAFFAPDSGGRTQLWVLSLDSPGAAAVRLTKQTDVTATRVRWMPDGRRLVYSADGRLWRIAATGGPPAEIPFTVSLSFERPKRPLPRVRNGAVRACVHGPGALSGRAPRGDAGARQVVGDARRRSAAGHRGRAAERASPRLVGRRRHARMVGGTVAGAGPVRDRDRNRLDSSHHGVARPGGVPELLLRWAASRVPVPALGGHDDPPGGGSAGP